MPGQQRMDEVVGYRNFADGHVLPVFCDADGRQYVTYIGRRFYGCWIASTGK